MKSILLISLIFSFKVMAHGDHGVPGSIPPAPNGGVVEEAIHQHTGSHKHDHVEASEREIFFEAKFKGNILSLYPLELDPKTSKTFIALNISDFSNIKIKVNDPRKKVLIPSEFKPKSSYWVIDTNKTRARRLVVLVSGIFKGGKYKAEIQVERK